MAINPNNFNPFVYDNEDKQNIETSCYTITYAGDFSQPGYKRVIATGQNEYFGTIEKEIELYVAIDDKDTLVSLNSDEFEYTGSEIKPRVNVKVNDQQIYQNYDDDYSAYSVSYQSNVINVGNYQLSVTSTNLLGGQIVKQFKIIQANINNIDISYDQEIYGDGTQKWPNIHYIKYNDNELTENVDYEIRNTQSYENIIPGDASITLQGKGNFIGDRRLEYDIYGDMKDCKLSCLLSDSVAYTGNEIKYQKTDFKLTWFDIDLSSIYNIRYITDNYIYPGEKRLEIYKSSDEHWRNQRSYTYSIVADIETDCSFYGYEELYYFDGREIKPEVIVQLNGSDKILKNGFDYYVEYDQNIDYSTAGHKYFTIHGKSPYYIGSKQIAYRIIPYLCFTAEEAGSTISMSKNGSAPSVQLETLTIGNDGSWTDFVVDETTITLENIGDKVYFRAKQDNNAFATDYNDYNKFVMAGKIAASGNINTLLKADGSVTDLSGRNYCYNKMFYNCTSLTQAPELPATILADRCYSYMFYSCTNLIKAPVLLATTLANNCYFSMFQYCTKLTEAPVLPATHLANYCYSSMFSDCTSLTSAPELPVETLAFGCYYYMFAGCKSLTQAPVLPATHLATYCYDGMFYDCTSLTQAPELPAETLTSYCYEGMFVNCTKLTKAPELPAKTLARYCYNRMFECCSNLNNINVNFSAWEPSNATTNWVKNVSSSGTFTCPVDLPEEFGSSRIPNDWTIKHSHQYLCFTAKQAGSTISMEAVGSAPIVYLETSTTDDEGSWTDFVVGNFGKTTITLNNVDDKIYFRAKRDNRAFAADFINYNKFVMTGQIAASGNLNTLLKADGSVINLTGRNHCYYRMFEGCTSLTQAPVLPATTLADKCYYAMFKDCKSLIQAPALPAKTLADGCYYNMFRRCTKLIQAPALPAKTLADKCYQSMFDGCTSLTQAQELPATTLADKCYYAMFKDCKSLIQAPALPATTLASNCYYGMFSGCTNLNSISVSFSAWEPSNATTNWVKNVSSSGTFTCPADLSTKTGSSRIPDSWTIKSYQWLCFTAEAAGSTISMQAVGSAPSVQLETSTTDDEGSWSDFVVGETTITLANVNDKVYFRAKQDNNVFATGIGDYNKFVMTGKIAASGNLNTLLKANGSVVDLAGKDYCYRSMFKGCTVLTQAPVLPATALSKSCYQSMFDGCTSLTQAPELPATTLADNCYRIMFSGCTSLSSAPELSATTLVYSCYSYMFRSCTNLAQAPALPATSLASGCYHNMFEGCTSLAQAPVLPATRLAINCYHNMFKDCKSLIQAPALPATTLVSNCYNSMFWGCTNLNSISVSFSAWSPTNATTDWVNAAASLGTFTCPVDLPEEFGTSRIREGWTVQRKL